MVINETLEIMDQDDAHNVNRMDYTIPYELKNDGWRLPTIDELHILKEAYKSGKGSLHGDWYMSDEGICPNKQVHLSDGQIKDFDTSESHWGTCRVRLVKTV